MSAGLHYFLLGAAAALTFMSWTRDGARPLVVVAAVLVVAGVVLNALSAKAAAK